MPASNASLNAVRGSSRDTVSLWHRNSELLALVRIGAMTIAQEYGLVHVESARVRDKTTAKLLFIKARRMEATETCAMHLSWACP